MSVPGCIPTVTTPMALAEAIASLRFSYFLKMFIGLFPTFMHLVSMIPGDALFISLLKE